jgi:protein deglycase
MKNLSLFLATGFEETEAIATLDVLRRASLNVKSVSTTGDSMVTGAHGISVLADALLEDVDFSEIDMLILPGGSPGTKNLGSNDLLKAIILEHAKKGKDLAAICAAPKILGQLGLLAGKEATCYPGNEIYLKDAKISDYMLVEDGNIITAAGAGVALDFGLQIVEYYLGEEKAEEISTAILLAANPN